MYCDNLEDSPVLIENPDCLPSIIQFTDLHLTESLKEARNLLNNVPGIYCLINQDSGTIYIGSSINRAPLTEYVTIL